MVIGRGMLAKEFREYYLDNDLLIFASGVSNSQETEKYEFDRENELLMRTIKEHYEKKMIYFSTCSMYDTYSKPNAYTVHKLRMEDLIKTYCADYSIFRLPQVLGPNNKAQLMGFLFERVKNNEYFDLFDIERNIIDISDVHKMVDYILEKRLFHKLIVNIANPKNIRVLDLVRIIEQIYNHKAKYRIIHKIGDFRIDTTLVDPIIKALDLFEPNYIEKRIRKYYG